MPLKDALIELCRAADVELDLDTDGVKAVGLNPVKPVTVELKDVRLETAIQRVLAALYNGNVYFSLDDGKLLVSSWNVLHQRLAKKLPDWLRPLHNH